MRIIYQVFFLPSCEHDGSRDLGWRSNQICTSILFKIQINDMRLSEDRGAYDPPQSVVHSVLLNHIYITDISMSNYCFMLNWFLFQGHNIWKCLAENEPGTQIIIKESTMNFEVGKLIIGMNSICGRYEQKYTMVRAS